MIQRIQSIYLLLAAVALGLQFVLPYASAPADAVAGASTTFADGVFNLNDRMWLLINSVLAAGLALAAVFFYKNRPTQSFVTSIGVFSATILSIYLAVQCYMLIGEAGQGVSSIHYQAGVGMPALSVLLMWLANRAIRKDEALVRSSDRLR